jgi:cell wall-associated NlpC family hydrolase
MAYQEVDIKLPRTTSGQSQTGKRKYIGELSEGDLVFFTARPKSSKITHVGMVTQINGDEITFIHASTSRGVMESTLNETYWRERYKMATRIIGE